MSNHFVLLSLVDEDAMVDELTQPAEEPRTPRGGSNILVLASELPAAMEAMGKGMRLGSMQTEGAFWAPELTANSAQLCEATEPAEGGGDEIDDSNCSILSTASTQSDEDVGGPPMMSTDSSADECDARACLRDETAYLEHILLSFFAIYAPEHIDEAKSLAASYVDHLAAVHEEMNAELRADLLTPTFLQSLSLSQNEMCHVICGEAGREAGIFEGHPQVYPKPTAKAFLPGQTVSASITEPEHMDTSADVDPRLSRRARLPVRSCLGQSDLGEC